MTNSTIARERLEELAAGQSGFNLRIATHEESQELARIALAAMDSEPVVYASEETLAYAAHGELLLRVLSQPAGDAIIPLYRHAQQPVVQMVAEESRCGTKDTPALDSLPKNAESRSGNSLANDTNVVERLTITLPDTSSKAFWSGTGKTETFHPVTYRRWVKEAIERYCTIARIDVEVK